MGTASLFYRSAYRFGSPHWDSDQPRAELKELVQGLRPGRALDLGCGTGTNVVYLAGQGWEAVGLDFVPRAIRAAEARALSAAVSARFVVGDVTQLRQAGIAGPFDLIIDIGCYHTVPEALRDSYATEVAAVTRPGADFYLAGISAPPASWRLLRASGLSPTEPVRRFGADFEIAAEQVVGTIGRGDFVLYHLVRKGSEIGR
jgi:SAM-dependent methyltransferase